MPEPVPIPSTIRAVLHMTQHGESRVMTIGIFKINGNIQLQDLIDVTTQLKSWWDDNFRTTLVNDIQLLDITATDISEVGGQQYAAPCLNLCAGTSTAGPAPGNATHTTSWRTASASRSGRGRTYWVGMDESHVNDDDTLSSTAQVATITRSIALMVILAGLDMRLAVVSIVDSISRDVVSFVVENILDSMRRRLPSRGT